MVMDLRGRVCMFCKRVWKMTFFGLKQGQDVENGQHTPTKNS